MLFDEVTDTIKVSGQATIGTQATYEARIRFTNEYQGLGVVFEEHRSGSEDKWFAVGPERLSGFQFGVNGAQLVSSPPVSLDLWHHIAFVYDGSEERLYLDGSQVASRAASGDVRDGDGSGFVGGVYRQQAAPELDPSMVGFMDTVRISSIPRYTGSTFIPPTGDLTSDAFTLLLYNFNDPPGSTMVTDESPLGRTGSLGVGFAGATSPTLVPEPGSIALLVCGAFTLLGFAWRRKRRSA